MSFHANLAKVSMRWQTLLLQTRLFWSPSQTRRSLPWSTESVHCPGRPHTAPVYPAGKSGCVGSRMARGVFYRRSLRHQEKKTKNLNVLLYWYQRYDVILYYYDCRGLNEKALFTCPPVCNISALGWEFEDPGIAVAIWDENVSSFGVHGHVCRLAEMAFVTSRFESFPEDHKLLIFSITAELENLNMDKDHIIHILSFDLEVLFETSNDFSLLNHVLRGLHFDGRGIKFNNSCAQTL